MAETISRKHSLPVRWFHWLNFPVLAFMVWSGLLIYWANDVYAIRWDGRVVVPFFPDPVYLALNIGGRLAEGLAWHLVLAWVFMANGALYVGYTVISGAWRDLVPTRASFREALQVVLYDLKLSKTHPPQAKFNGAQRFAYSGVVLMGVGSTATGLAILKPVQLGWLTALCGGYETARLVHFVLTLAYVAFFVVHVAQVVRAGLANFLSMITGHELVDPAEVAR